MKHFFDLNKKVNLIVSVLSMLGILTIFLPWIEYPKLEKVLYGYHGDGFFLSFLFFIIFCISFYLHLTSIKGRGKSFNRLIFILSISILLVSLRKIFQFNREVSEYLSDNPIMSYAASGAKLGSGLYIICLIGIAIMILSLFSKLFSKTRNLIIIFLVGILLTAAFYFGSKLLKPELAESEVIENLTSDFNKMGQSLIDKRPEGFVEYVHPIIYTSMGGKRKMTDMMRDVYASSTITKAEITKIEKKKREGDDIQCLIYQTVMMLNSSGQEIPVTNKTFAFSYDGGRTWTFAGTEDKTFEEMQIILPEIFDELRY